ncbi:UDP-N-acetylglucosamine transferase subunit ALG13 [bacterium A37T11]|nr:UDP-N-acetylglucosamine transferase subunit ALG13 [bacterium A37T11]
MIFVTIGTQEPFERLMGSISKLSFKIPEVQIFIQARTKVLFEKNVKIFDFLTPEDFDKYFDHADLIISHAGMGTILSALTKGKAILIMPRNAKLGEHRNEHQFATARKMQSLKYVNIAWDENDLVTNALDIVQNRRYNSLHKIGNWASDELTNSIREFLEK